VNFVGSGQQWDSSAAGSPGYFQELATCQQQGTMEFVARVNDFPDYLLCDKYNP